MCCRVLRWMRRCRRIGPVAGCRCHVGLLPSSLPPLPPLPPYFATLLCTNPCNPSPPDDDVRLARRIQRDVASRGRDVASEWRCGGWAAGRCWAWASRRAYRTVY